jgi:DNA-binding CsgD family transcriptional regulator
MAKLKYDESFPARAGEYAAKGMNNSQIAANLKIGSETFYAYQRQFPEFAEAIALGRQTVDDGMETGVLDLAMGNCFVTAVRNSDSGREIKTVRQRAPDLKAVIYWLDRNKQYADEKPAGLPNPKPVSGNAATSLKYDDELFPARAEICASSGDTDSQIAKRLGISPASFYNYKKHFPEFAAALDSGRRQCYSLLRSQLLAIATGDCTVRTELYHDGRLRKTTVRQLPPNLKAIVYWLAQRDSRLSGTGGCPASSAGRSGEDIPAQDVSKLSGSDGCPESSSAQELSKLSGISATADFHAVHVVHTVHTAGIGGKTDNLPAQELSKLSGSDGCPAGSAGRMDRIPAQELSKLSGMSVVPVYCESRQTAASTETSVNQASVLRQPVLDAFLQV